jgi:predicted DNA-binding transcriptional regulator AlpA
LPNIFDGKFGKTLLARLTDVSCPRKRGQIVMQLILDQKRVATILGISTRTLERYRLTGMGPPYAKIGGKLIRYRQSDLEAWVQQNLSHSTSDKPTS